MSEPTLGVYKAMAAVMADISKVGVAKDQTNKQQGFKYRGVDDVMNALAPILSKHGLLIVPQVIDRAVTERESKSGGTLFHTVLRMQFEFIAAADGSKHVTAVIGESMDSGDKATNKAMSVAYKYACFQAFCIPLEGDPDAQTHEVKPNSVRAAVAEISGTGDEAPIEYQNAAARMREALEVGIDDAVYEMHQELNRKQEFYVAVSGLLTAGERKLWKDAVRRVAPPSPNGRA